MDQHFQLKMKMPPLRGISHLPVLTLIVLLTSVIGFPTPCPENEYRDHGTDNCEHCQDICRFAQIQKTVETCLQLCPAYALKIGLSLNPSGDKNADKTSTPSHLPTVDKAGIAGISVAGVVVCAIVLLAFFNRNRVRHLLKGPSPPPALSGEDDASVPSLRTGVLEEGDARETGDDAGRVQPSDQDAFLRSLHHQESIHGRRGNYELAVNCSSSGSGLDDDNVEPKTFNYASPDAPGMAASPL